jgi:hypothetical protein
MADPVEKGRKRRRRSARVYVNANKPLAVNVPEIAALFPPDEDDDGAPAGVGKRHVSQSERKRLAREGSALPDGSFPIADASDLANAADHVRLGHGDVAAARRLIARRSKELGVPNPLEEPAAKSMMPGNSFDGPNYSAHRLSEPLTASHQSPSAADHGVGQGRNQAIAEHHPDLRQSTTASAPWYGMRTAEGDNQYGDRSITHVPGQVNVSFLDLRQAAPASSALLPSGNPVARRADHSAPSSPASNGVHSMGDLRDPASHAAPAAVKGAPVGGRVAMEMLRQVVRDAMGPR